MSKPILVKTHGLNADIRRILEAAGRRWQTSSLIAAQIVFAPDALARCAGRQGKKKPSKGGDLVARRLSSFFADGITERRIRPDGKMEHRIAQPDRKAQQAESIRRIRQTRKANGLCGTCGVNVAATNCETCRVKKRDKERQRRAMRKLAANASEPHN